MTAQCEQLMACRYIPHLGHIIPTAVASILPSVTRQRPRHYCYVRAARVSRGLCFTSTPAPGCPNSPLQVCFHPATRRCLTHHLLVAYTKQLAAGPRIPYLGRVIRTPRCKFASIRDQAILSIEPPCRSVSIGEATRPDPCGCNRPIPSPIAPILRKIAICGGLFAFVHWKTPRIYIL